MLCFFTLAEWLLHNPMLSSTCSSMQTETMLNEENSGAGHVPQSPAGPHLGENLGTVTVTLGSNFPGM